MTEIELKQFKQEMKDHVGDTIRSVVNGKIDKLTLKVDDYIKEDGEWKVRAEPVVKAFENGSWLWKLFIATLKFFGLVSVGIGGYIAIKKLFS